MTLEVGGAPIALPPSRKARALLAYLAAEPGARSRSWLCDLLWEGPSDPRAALRWSLSKLRGVLPDSGPLQIASDGESVELRAPPQAVDLRVLAALVDAGLETVDTDRLEWTFGLFRGSFLEALQLNGCHRFDAWRTAKAEWYRRVRREVTGALLDRLSSSPDRSLPYALEHLAQEPWSESAYVRAAELMAALGRRGEAFDLLERGTLVLEGELGLEPSERLLTLRSSLESFRSSDPRSGWDVSSTDAPARRLATARAALRRGRTTEVSDLLKRIEEASSGSAPLDPELTVQLCDAYAHPSMREHRPPDLTARVHDLAGRAKEAGRGDLVRHALYLIANLHYQDGDFEGAFHSTSRAEAAGRDQDPFTVVKSIADTARCLAMLERELPRADRLAEEARSLVATLEEPVIELPIASGLIARYRGRYDEALQHFEDALTLMIERDDDWWEAYCRLWVPMVQLELECPADVLVSCGRLRSVLALRDDVPEGAFAGVLEAAARAGLDLGMGAALEDDLSTLRRAGSGWMLVYGLLALADGDLGESRVSSAKRRAEEALDRARALGRSNDVVRAHTRLALAEARSGDPGSAARRLDQARAVAGEVDLSTLAIRSIAETAEELGR